MEDFQLDRKRLADQIADALMAMIARGSLKPGDRLPPEPELMKQFKVGRSSIREAVGALSLVGLLTVRPGQGTHVASFSAEGAQKPVGLLGLGPEKVWELVEARIELEGVIAGLAAERATQEDLERIREKHRDLKKAMAGDEDPINPDLEFHGAVARACHNSVLVKFFHEMRQPTRHWMEQKARHDWGYENVVEQHRAIVRAVEARDPALAQEALRSHLESTGERLVAAIMGKGDSRAEG
ncbi:FadR/GntR family transcriptional regulator [Desulfospira joergensenii]|uniref:FadR/GntR family transcriptional regulator n=1 Tax=Desulfospira joergensenii TaxID=53329 RepID=UPI0003B66CFB|nr:FadR/GntR family transcriptional regulator [Desulfospira joergensenii]